MMKRLLIFTLVLCLAFLCGCEYIQSIEQGINNVDEISGNESLPLVAEGEMRVHFLDVGQGDSVFIELPDGSCMLIDAGVSKSGNSIVDFIKGLGYTKIDHLIATHPHADHIGGMQKVVESFEIGEVYMPEAVTDTKTFLNLLEAMDAKGLTITPVTAGLKIDFGGAWGEFLAPVYIVDDLNNCSAVLMLTHGQRKFLFTGDAEIDEEVTFTGNLKCDVLKVGHHGSSTSSGTLFLAEAKPSLAVISCGKDNSYGHPHKEALERLEKAGVEKIYRTDVSGTVSISTDGELLNVSVEKGE